MQLTVIAIDRGSPPRSGSTQVVVTVRRNEFSPSFVRSSYRATIDESATPVVPILTTIATDNDVTLQPLVNHVLRLLFGF